MFEYMKCYGRQREDRIWKNSRHLPFMVTDDIKYWFDLGCLWNDGDRQLAWWWRNKR